MQLAWERVSTGAAVKEQYIQSNFNPRGMKGQQNKHKTLHHTLHITSFHITYYTLQHISCAGSGQMNLTGNCSPLRPASCTPNVRKGDFRRLTALTLRLTALTLRCQLHVDVQPCSAQHQTVRPGGNRPSEAEGEDKETGKDFQVRWFHSCWSPTLCPEVSWTSSSLGSH